MHVHVLLPGTWLQLAGVSYDAVTCFGITQILIFSFQANVMRDTLVLIRSIPELNSKLPCSLPCTCCHQSSEVCWAKEVLNLGLSCLWKICDLKVVEQEHTEPLHLGWGPADSSLGKRLLSVLSFGWDLLYVKTYEGTAALSIKYEDCFALGDWHHSVR
jgi:hypothetical protein